MGEEDETTLAADPQDEGYGTLQSNQLELSECYERIGLGKAQIFFWVALSCVAYSDMSELVIISILIPYLRCEWGLTILFEALLNCSVFFFYATSGMVFGKLSDKHGRRSTLTVTLSVLLIASFGSALATNKWQFLVARSIVGICIGANLPTIIVFSAEVVESQYREIGPTIVLFWVNAAMMIVALLAYIFLNWVGWRWFIVIASLPILPALILLKLMPESPRFLCAKGAQKEATAAVKKMAEWNEKSHTLPYDLVVIVHQDQQLGQIKDILAPKYLKETVLLSMMYFGNIFLIFGLIVFVPLAINSGFCGASTEGATRDCKNIDQKGLGQIVIITSGGTVAIFVGLFLGIKIGRNFSMKLLNTLVFISTLFLFPCFSGSITTALLFLIKCFAASANLIIWIVIPELYPTVIRNTATGFINMWGKSGGVIATALVYIIFYISGYLMVACFVLSALLSMVAAWLWTKETRDVDLQDVDA